MRQSKHQFPFTDDVVIFPEEFDLNFKMNSSSTIYTQTTGKAAKIHMCRHLEVGYATSRAEYRISQLNSRESFVAKEAMTNTKDLDQSNTSHNNSIATQFA